MKTIFTETTEFSLPILKFKDSGLDPCDITEYEADTLLLKCNQPRSYTISLSRDHVADLIPRLQSWLDGKGLHINQKKQKP